MTTTSGFFSINNLSPSEFLFLEFCFAILSSRRRGGLPFRLVAVEPFNS
jgi:hypothetical protein